MEAQNQFKELSKTDIWEIAAHLMIHRHLDIQNTVDLLTEMGVNPEYANETACDLSVQIREEKSRIAENTIFRGLIWFALGLLITVFTYDMDLDGHTYFLAWGGIIYGGLQILAGIIQFHGTKS